MATRNRTADIRNPYRAKPEEDTDNQRYTNRKPLKQFTTCYIASLIFGLGSIAVLVLWIMIVKDGFGWINNDKKRAFFNWHPLLMTAGLVFLQGQAIIWHRVFRKFPPTVNMLFVFLGQFITFGAMILSLYIVFQYERKTTSSAAALDDVHGWVGIITACTFTIQFIAGVLIFVYPKAPTEFRTVFTNIYNFFGTVIFLFACTAACMGMSLAETVGWGIGGVFCKLFVVGIFLYGLLIAYIATMDKFDPKRKLRGYDAGETSGYIQLK